jgi:hypothetical protein
VHQRPADGTVRLASASLRLISANLRLAFANSRLASSLLLSRYRNERASAFPCLAAL